MTKPKKTSRWSLQWFQKFDIKSDASFLPPDIFHSYILRFQGCYDIISFQIQGGERLWFFDYNISIFNFFERSFLKSTREKKHISESKIWVLGPQSWLHERSDGIFKIREPQDPSFWHFIFFFEWKQFFFQLGFCDPNLNWIKKSDEIF